MTDTQKTAQITPLRCSRGGSDLINPICSELGASHRATDKNVTKMCHICHHIFYDKNVSSKLPWKRPFSAKCYKERISLNSLSQSLTTAGLLEQIANEII